MASKEKLLMSQDEFPTQLVHCVEELSETPIMVD